MEQKYTGNDILREEWNEIAYEPAELGFNPKHGVGVGTFNGKPVNIIDYVKEHVSG